MSVSLKQSIVPKFGRHETFTPRYSWFKRGYDAVADPDFVKNRRAIQTDYYVFNDDDAHHHLGVGKNMARSIRFWLQAARLVEELKVEGSRAPVGVPTVFGQTLLDGASGLDPHLEQPGTWWLLHWMMVSPGSYLPVWWAAFHTFGAVNFTTAQVLEHVEAQIDATSAWQQPKRPKASTVKKDVLAMLRNYAGTSGSRRRDLIDDELDAPFVSLTLIRPTDEAGHFRFGLGPKPALPAAVAAFACLDFLSRTNSTAKQVLVATLATEQGAPGRAFKLTERDLVELLSKAAADNPDLIQITSAAGSDALAVVSPDTFGLVAAQVLHRHYRSLGSGAPEPAEPYLPWSEATEFDDRLRLVRDAERSWT